MRFQLMLLSMLLSAVSFASDDKELRDLFNKYEEVMAGSKIDVADQIFTKKFLAASGGKAKFMEKVKSLPPTKVIKDQATWKKGVKGDLYFAKLDKKSESQFIVVKEDGKLKIDGTLSDDN